MRTLLRASDQRHDFLQLTALCREAVSHLAQAEQEMRRAYTVAIQQQQQQVYAMRR